MSCPHVGRTARTSPQALSLGQHRSNIFLNWVYVCFTSEFRSCVKVEVAVLGSPPLTVLVVSVDVKQYLRVVHLRGSD